MLCVSSCYDLLGDSYLCAANISKLKFEAISTTQVSSVLQSAIRVHVMFSLSLSLSLSLFMSIVGALFCLAIFPSYGSLE